jgi:hypothetical protein
MGHENSLSPPRASNATRMQAGWRHHAIHREGGSGALLRFTLPPFGRTRNSSSDRAGLMPISPVPQRVEYSGTVASPSK